MPATLPFIDRSLLDDLVVIDGGSTDGTIEYALKSGLTFAYQIRQGMAFAICDLVRSLEHDHVIEFNPDGNCKIEQLPEIMALLQQGYEHVVGSFRISRDRWRTSQSPTPSTSTEATMGTSYSIPTSRISAGTCT